MCCLFRYFSALSIVFPQAIDTVVITFSTVSELLTFLSVLFTLRFFRKFWNGTALTRPTETHGNYSRRTRKASLKYTARRKGGFLFQESSWISLTWYFATVLYSPLPLLRWLFGAEDRWLLREQRVSEDPAEWVSRGGCSRARGKQRSAAEYNPAHTSQFISTININSLYHHV